MFELKGLLVVSVIATILFSRFAIARPGSEMQDRIPICGESAVYMMLQLHGIRTDLNSVMNVIRRRSDASLSFLDLCEIGSSNGIEFEGIRVRNLEELPREPMIAALQHEPTGHFIVLHPIEGSPTLVQVYDQNSEPKAINIDKLMANRQWTGHVLVKKRPIISWSRLSLLSTGASIISVIALIAYRLRFAKGGTKAGNEVVVS